MIYNRISLFFPQEAEKEYRSINFKESLLQLRVALFFVATLYALFSVLDYKLFPEYTKLFYTIRFLIVIPTIALTLLLSFFKGFSKIWQILLFINYVLAGIGICIMVINLPDHYAYFGGLMLVFSAGYFFIKLRFFLASIAGWSLILFYNLGALIFSDNTGLVVLSNNFFFIAANIIGMYAAYNIEYNSRRNFFLNKKLDYEKMYVDELNKNLEFTVEERTHDLKKAKEKAEESDKLKSAFLANMSHEIRTPMNGILGFADLLKEPGLNTESQHEYIEIINRSGERMLNIINDIISISKIEAGQVSVNIQKIDINELMKQMSQFFIPEIESKQLEFIIKIPENLSTLSIYSDEDKFYTIWSNLIKNSIKFTHEGYVEIGYSKQDDQLRFYVKDSGIGIPSHRVDSIFERFIQADIADVNAYQGAGLGLSISKAYIEKLGGTIDVDTTEGLGSCFSFSLPMNKH